MSKIEFDYYYGIEADQFEFFKIPKVLFEPYFAELSTDAKVLYGLMLDRMCLSRINGWLDDNNRVFIIFTRKQIMEALRCSVGTARKLTSELIAFDLIEMQSLGAGKTDIIYVKNFVNQELISSGKKNEPVQKLEGYKNKGGNNLNHYIKTAPTKNVPANKMDRANACSGTPTESCGEPLQNFSPINTNINNTNMSDTESSVQPVAVQATDDIKIAEQIKQNIKYDEHYLYDSREEFEIYNQMYCVILEVIFDKGYPYEMIKVGKEEVIRDSLIQQFKMLREHHLLNIRRKVLQQKPEKISDIRGYLKTAMFNEITKPVFSGSKKNNGRTGDYERRDYDMDEIEKLLLS